jgi:hypothetical protein
MTELKTNRNRASVQEFLRSVENDKRRKDARVVLKLMRKLGKYKTGKSCLYVNKLEDIDLDVLRQLIADSVANMRQTA